ncbi:molybdate ABC transporter substrate-binding protein [Microbacterium oxydans]|uniref:molybdate ABC transporter substrate-binding protein n=1 Tax=Microbacterium oxydans TaxID=82380 RepID=UPI000B850678|nr:molybdate ABC transporter substrate-binding protein [Microbacterium oxydans]
MNHRLLTGSAALVLALLLGGCSAAPSADPSPSAADGELTGEVTVFAAASLSPVFDEIAAAFTAEHPAVEVAPIVYDGSSVLVTQLTEGAQADVLATADERTMQTLVDTGLAEDPESFATNTLVVAVPAGNPAGITSLADLAEATTVLCAPEVPCGAASQTLLRTAGVSVTAASLEQNVSAVLQKIVAGEADAGLVYATDVVGEDVESFAPEGSDEVVNRYPIVALDGATEAGRAFTEFVRGPVGRQILADHGFGTP